MCPSDKKDGWWVEIGLALVWCLLMFLIWYGLRV